MNIYEGDNINNKIMIADAACTSLVAIMFTYIRGLIIERKGEAGVRGILYIFTISVSRRERELHQHHTYVYIYIYFPPVLQILPRDHQRTSTLLVLLGKCVERKNAHTCHLSLQPHKALCNYYFFYTHITTRTFYVRSKVARVIGDVGGCYFARVPVIVACLC